MTLTEMIKKSNNSFTFLPASEKCIHQAEQELNVTFSKEYTDYLSTYGVAVFDSHELTGLCDGKRLDVVRITQEQKNCNQFIPHDSYVVECLDIDDCVIWQNSDGAIFVTTPNTKPKRIANSLIDYLTK